MISVRPPPNTQTHPHTRNTHALDSQLLPALLNIHSFFLSYFSFYRKTEIWVQTCEAEINEICRQWDQILFDESSEYHVSRLLQLKVLSSIQPRLYIYSCFPASHSPSPPPSFSSHTISHSFFRTFNVKCNCAETATRDKR